MDVLESPKVVSPEDKSAYYDGALRMVRTAIGVAGEERVGAIFDEHFGKVSRGAPHHSEGTNFYPDLILTTPKKRYAVEVKTMIPFHKTGGGTRKIKGSPAVSVASLNIQSWEGMSRFARSRIMERLLVVEVRIEGSGIGHLYHVVPGDTVDWKIARSNAREWVSFSTYDLPALSLVSFRPGLERTVDLAVMAL
jgi:hypothetical protein